MNGYAVPMEGHLPQFGLRGGFMGGAPPVELGPNIPIITRGGQYQPSAEMMQRMAEIERGTFTGDVNQVLMQLGQNFAEFQRAITSATSNFPVRENLEAEAKILTPLDTPLRNRLRRKLGAGLASLWRQATSIGGGWGAATTVTTGASSATQTVGSTANMVAGDVLYFATTNATRIVSSITNTTTVVLTATISTTTAEVVTKANIAYDTIGPIRGFFAESGAPADHATAYAAKTAPYKLLGSFGSVTGFAMAAGASFTNQLAYEKTNSIRNLMLNEENALINGDVTATGAPWGDGSNALAFAGLINLITTANGTPGLQVQSAVGALTTAHIDAQLNRLWVQGAQGMYMILNAQECASLAHLAEASGSVIRVMYSADGRGVLGVAVTGYVHPVSQQLVDIIASRFIAPGTMVFGCDRLPDGTPAADVDVLPQVQLPQLAPNEDIQGYTAQEIAPTTSAPQVYPFMTSVYEVLRMKSALHFAKSTGVTPV